ncbi:MAG: hypothetical protein ACRELY_32660 [Polyangiaceae bacterium]
MPRGSPAVKMAITVDSEVHDRVLRAARLQGQSVSAWMTNAARRSLALRDGLLAVREWEEEHGEFSEAELRAARKKVAEESSGRKRRRSVRR